MSITMPIYNDNITANQAVVIASFDYTGVEDPYYTKYPQRIKT